MAIHIDTYVLKDYTSFELFVYEVTIEYSLVASYYDRDWDYNGKQGRLAPKIEKRTEKNISF